MKIRLRPYKPADARWLEKWVPSDIDGFWKWSAGRFQYPLSEGDLDAHYRWFECAEDGFIMLALDEKGAPCGHFTVRKIDYVSESARLGFIIVDPALRGKGVGRAMLEAAKEYAFGSLGLESLELGVFEDNLPAYRCYISAGFCEEGFEDSITFPDGSLKKIIRMTARKRKK
ncbi:MAG: GNAT family N-acetyltransferase [Firmicutes bacterium]|nr:GNAT family N-acetyltransferase [Bacillota bacterium]